MIETAIWSAPVALTFAFAWTKTWLGNRAERRAAGGLENKTRSEAPPGILSNRVVDQRPLRGGPYVATRDS